MSEVIFRLGRFEVQKVSTVNFDKPFQVYVTDGGWINQFDTKAQAIAEARTCHAEDQQGLK